MRRFILAGNWKMNRGPNEARSLAKAIKEGVNIDKLTYEVVLCPPFPSLQPVREVIRDSKIYLGAQNVHWEDSGAYTGEVSLPMLEELGVQFVIIGHSERRKYFCETDKTVNLKLKRVLRSDIAPILCIGETLEERKDGRAKTVVERQLKEAFKELSAQDIRRVVIAYEPVWAIGTGISASTEDIDDMHKTIRSLLNEWYNGLGSGVSILYGGSVKPENVNEITKLGSVDGALIGGASIKAESFLQILKRSHPKG
jgi:triosephosphate isomerase